MEYTDEEWDAVCDDRQSNRYRAHLAAHPHPADPDHPEEYELEDDDE